jgi:predicted ATP-dependent serine protease
MAPEGAHVALVGRDDELLRFADLLGQVAGGRWQAALIEGEAGAGKSLLLDNVIARAHVRGLRILHGSAEEFERDRPLGPLRKALGLDSRPLDDAQAEVNRLLLAGADVAPSLVQSRELRFTLIDAVVALVEAQVQRAPILLVLDDLHWPTLSPS